MIPPKKGAMEVGVLIEMFWKLAFIVFIFGTTALVVLQLSSLAFESGSVEASSIAHRIVTSKGGISHFDPLSNRVYPFEIRFDTFGSPEQIQQLDNLILQLGIEQWAGRITLFDLENETLAITYFNRDKYDLWSPQGDSGQSALARRTRGSIQRFDFTFPVALIQNEGDVAAYVVISLYHPRGLQG